MQDVLLLKVSKACFTHDIFEFAAELAHCINV